MPSRTPEYSVTAERPVRGGRRLDITFAGATGRVPAALLLPLGDTRPGPAALLLHGYSSDKERMLAEAGGKLLDRGVASLAIDLPMHGEREERPDGEMWRNPLGLVRIWKGAQDDCAAALRLLGAMREVDPARIGVVGFSLGSFLAVTVAGADQRVRAVVLAAGGDLPASVPFAPLIRSVVDPAKSARKLKGRPLLMVHGRRDRTILPEQAERLYAAATEPKELRWYEGGHWLPAAAVEGAAEWLAGALGSDGTRATGSSA